MTDAISSSPIPPEPTPPEGDSSRLERDVELVGPYRQTRQAMILVCVMGLLFAAASFGFFAWRLYRYTLTAGFLAPTTIAWPTFAGHFLRGIALLIACVQLVRLLGSPPRIPRPASSFNDDRGRCGQNARPHDDASDETARGPLEGRTSFGSARLLGDLAVGPIVSVLYDRGSVAND